jgi:hypothetical protein
MANPRRTHYDELGVKRNATDKDIERAFRKYRSEMDLPTAAPDRLRENRMKSAYETLIDPAKRAAYDAMLAGPRKKERSKGMLMATLGVLVLAGVAGAAYVFKPAPPPPVGNLAIDAITHKASLAVNRVDSMDLSGKPSPIGIAFAIDEGTVATTCSGISPMSVLTLFMPPQAIPVKVAQVDEKLGVCKLFASGIGSWPLPVTSAEPHPGDTIYMTKVNAVGEVSLVEAKVKRVVPSPRGKVIETSIAVLPERQGGPVLDARGHVIGVALLPDSGGVGEVVRITPDWAVRAKPVAPPQPVIEAPAAAPENATTSRVKSYQEIEDDRRRRLDEAVRKNLQ